MRLLLITRHYPPAISGGAKRPYLLTQALRRLGAEVFVIAPSLPDGEFGLAVPHPNRDPSGAPPARATWRDYAREWLLWPDPDIRWCLKAAAAAANAPWRPDWVWTTSPPESIHVAGWLVKRRSGVQWHADFRDHWLVRPHRVQRRAFHRQFGERLIARCLLPSADLVTCVDSSIQGELRSLRARDPRIAPHFSTPIAPAPIELPDDDINLVHSGSIELSDPEAKLGDLLKAFETALQQNPALRLHMVGRLSANEISAIERSPARARVEVCGAQPLDVALGYQRAADALILVGSPKTHVPPSKIVDYLASQAPILAFGDGDWRSDPRLSPGNSTEALVTLKKGERRTQGPPPLTSFEAASQLLTWMSAAPSV